MGGDVSDPLSWQAITSIKTQLATIRTSAGYQTEIGASVHTDTAPVDSITASPRTAVVAGDFTQDDEHSNRNILATEITITVEAVIPATYKQSEKVAHQAMQDIRLCLKNTSEYLPTGARTLAARGARLIRRPEGAKVIIVQMDFTLGITERTN